MLRAKAYRGFIWSGTELLGQQGVRFIVQIFLARILAPEQFGMLAIVVVFVGIGTGLTDAGFGNAIIQRQKLDQLALSSVFHLNILLGVTMAAILWFAAPAIAVFYREAELIPLLRVISFSIPLAALGQVHHALLRKSLEFRRIALASFPSTLISGGVAVWWALRGGGIWALVIQVLLQHFLQTLFLWFASRWRPNFKFSINSIRPLFAYGSKLALAGFIDQIFRNIYVLVIGRLFLPTDVGFYQRADAFKNMGSQNLNRIVSRVTFPLYSKIQNDPDRLQKAFLRTSALLALFFFPIMGTMAGVAEPLVLTLIGDKWMPSVVYLQLLCVVGAFYPIHAINLSIIKALGRSDLFLRLEIIKKCLIVSVLFISFRYGIVAMILGQIFCSWIALWINAYYTRRFIGTGYMLQMKQYLPAMVLAGVIFIVTSMVIREQILPARYELLLGLFVATIIFVIGIYMLRAVFKPEMTSLIKRSPGFTPVYRFLYPESNV